MSPVGPLAQENWREQLRRASHIDHGLKFLGLAAFMAVFFAGYFAVMKFPLFSVTEMPATALDRAVAFYPWAIVLYLSLWFYVALPVMFLTARAELVHFAGSAGVVSVAGMVFFLFFPTRIPPPVIDWSRFPAFDFLRKVDQSGNACPSLHAAFAMFSALWLDRLLRRASAPTWARVVNAGWCVGILYSTLATKQHVALDVLAGVILGAAGFVWPFGKR